VGGDSSYSVAIAAGSTYARITSRLLPPEIIERIHYYPPALRAAHFLKDRLAESVPLKDAARAAGMERCAFSRFFSERIGITFSDFARVLRVERALEALNARDVGIGELGALVGISHSSTFVRTFRRIVGCTPSQYKKRCLYASGGGGQ